MMERPPADDRDWMELEPIPGPMDEVTRDTIIGLSVLGLAFAAALFQVWGIVVLALALLAFVVYTRHTP